MPKCRTIPLNLYKKKLTFEELESENWQKIVSVIIVMPLFIPPFVGRYVFINDVISMSREWQFPGSYSLHFVLIKCQISSTEHLFLHVADNAVNQVQLKANCAGKAHLMFKTKLTVLLRLQPEHMGSNNAV